MPKSGCPFLHIMRKVFPVDANTIAAIDWQHQGFDDRASKLVWKQRGTFSTSNIAWDNTFGHVFHGNSSCFWSANQSAYVPSNNGSVTAEFWFKVAKIVCFGEAPWEISSNEDRAVDDGFRRSSRLSSATRFYWDSCGYEGAAAGGFCLWSGGWSPAVVGGGHVGFRLAKW